MRYIPNDDTDNGTIIFFTNSLLTLIFKKIIKIEAERTKLKIESSFVMENFFINATWDDNLKITYSKTNEQSIRNKNEIQANYR